MKESTTRRLAILEAAVEAIILKICKNTSNGSPELRQFLDEICAVKTKTKELDE